MTETQSTKKNLNVVIIRIKEEKYLLEVKHVKEIYIPGEKIIPIPLADHSIVGIIDVRGEIYSILSLKKKIYSQEQIFDLDKKSRILLLEMNGLNLSVLVDEVIGVQEIPLSAFSKSNKIVETDLDFEFIKSIGVINGGTHILLDIKNFIRSFNINTDYRARDFESKYNEKEEAFEDQHTPQIDIETERPYWADDSDAEIYEIEAELSKLKKKIKLTPEQRDLLQEVGNIGSGNAVTALSHLVKKKIDIDLTNVGIISFDNLATQFGGPDQQICGIFSQIKDTPQSTIFQAFEMKPLMRLIASVAGKDTKIDPEKVNSKKDLDEYAISTIKEMGNILAGHYASALADLTETKMMIEVPQFTISSVSDLGKFLSKELETIYTFVVVIKTSMKIVDYELNGVFLFIPDLDTLYDLFDNLNIKYNPLVEDKRRITKITNPKQLRLSDTQRDALQEIGNIGSGNAANALAKMINKKVTINIPSVEMMTLDSFSEKIQTENELFTTWSNVEGKSRATVLTMFEVSDIIEIASILTDDKKKKQLDLRKKYDNIDKFPDIYQSAMSELGNILASNYISSLGDLLDIKFMTQPPDMIIDTAKKLFQYLKSQIGFLGKTSLIITTAIIITDIKIEGAFIFVPEISTLHELLSALEQFYE
ncbi:MAG: CheY-P phosphatase CheC [Promethearchaeota archaeon]|nr:MAG: CheY-P phosphatase CheC [Candidatus Lokiarchaeota archaeon]